MSWGFEVSNPFLNKNHTNKKANDKLTNNDKLTFHIFIIFYKINPLTLKTQTKGNLMSLSLSPSLIDLNESFPINYSIEFDCSESNLEEIVEKVASFTSRVYATFPALGKEGREQLKKAGVWINKLDIAPFDCRM